jgi:hypothetical protein
VLRSFLIVGALACLLAGCGSSPKDVSKAEYEQHLQLIGTNLYTAANHLGESTAIGPFNQNVQRLQDTIDDSAHDLSGLRPPGAAAQAANTRLVHAYHDLSDEFEKVKDARRESYPKAIAALVAVQTSEPAKASIRAANDLRKLGFQVPTSATIGTSP